MWCLFVVKDCDLQGVGGVFLMGVIFIGSFFIFCVRVWVGMALGVFLGACAGCLVCLLLLDVIFGVVRLWWWFFVFLSGRLSVCHFGWSLTDI